MYWDSHCHLTDPRMNTTLGEVLTEAKAHQISGFGLGGYDPADWQRQIDLSKKYPSYTFALSFGLHPMWVSEVSEEEIEQGLNSLARWASQAHAIGEIGLDARPAYQSAWEKQAEAFRSQLEIAGWAGKPILLHSVRAHAETLQILTLHREMLRGGFVHAFQGNRDLAEQYLQLNLAISIGGRITHSPSLEFQDMVRTLPAEALLLETDSPDQKVKNWPSPLHRPVALWDIAKVVGELRGESAEAVLQLSSENFKRILRI